MADFFFLREFNFIASARFDTLIDRPFFQLFTSFSIFLHNADPLASSRVGDKVTQAHETGLPKYIWVIDRHAPPFYRALYSLYNSPSPSLPEHNKRHVLLTVRLCHGKIQVQHMDTNK